MSRILPNIDFASRRSFAIAAAAAGSAGAFWPTTASAGVLDLIGYSDLAARNGALLERGAGVDVAQVEVPPTGTADYAPDTSLSSFAGKTFTFRTGATGVSSHAAQVAALIYASGTSPAPEVGHVGLFSAEGFVTDLLRTGRSTRGPGAAGAQVINNSWVAAYSANATNVDAVRRLDDLINRDDILVFNAVANGASDGIPKLLASSYNGVSVGTLTGARGPFVFDSSAPRIKPDLVVDAGITSNATALASGAGALLRSEANARGMAAGELAIKAILMAGAHRDASWHHGRNSGADNVTAPLDFQQGAGQLRVDNSFDILTGGERPAGVSTGAGKGWDSARTGRHKRSATYYLHVDQPLANWAAVLTWNRVIAGMQENGHYSTEVTLADMDLSLYLSKRGGRRLVARSDSPSDNVETLTLTDLAPGDYQLELTTDLRAYYAMAWYAAGDEQSPAWVKEVPRPGAAGLVMIGANGMSASQAPEPSTLGLAGIAAGALMCRRRARRT